MNNNAPIRIPAVSGLFYPDDTAELRAMLDAALESEKNSISCSAKPGDFITGGVVPHAGLVYCARQAVHFFECYRRSGQVADTVVIVHPNHRGVGPRMSVDGHHGWQTPLGTIDVDRDLMDALDLPVSPEAQEQEHSAEVLVPYIQHFLHDGLCMVSVNILHQDAHGARELAQKIHDASVRLKREVLLLASSDFSHFLSPEKSAPLDDMVLQKIAQRDTDGVCSVVESYGISVCGYGPIMTLMEYSRLIDPDYVSQVLRRGHSGEVSPSNKVVNYISILFETSGTVK